MSNSGEGGLHRYNPFSKREEHPRLSVRSYQILTALSYILAVITSFYYSFHSPHTGPHHHSLWNQNRGRRTPFALSPIIQSIYWIITFVLQLGYVGQLWSGNSTHVTAACNVGGHFILHNLLFFGYIMLIVRGHYFIALVLLIVNFFNLSSAYFRHPTNPKSIHVPTVSWPLAWNFVMLYTTGAAAVNAHSLPARILANIAVWGILVYGMFFLVAYKDYTIGFALTVLSASLGAEQFLVHTIAFQWIFAFVIMGLLFFFTVWTAAPAIFGGREPFPSGTVVSEDQERQPLLRE